MRADRGHKESSRRRCDDGDVEQIHYRRGQMPATTLRHTTGQGAVMEAERGRKLWRKRRRCAASTLRSACAVIVLLNCDTLCSRLSPCGCQHMDVNTAHRDVRTVLVGKRSHIAERRQTLHKAQPLQHRA